MYATGSSRIGLAFRTRPTAPTQAYTQTGAATKSQYDRIREQLPCERAWREATCRSGRIGRKLTPFRVLRPPQKQGTNQKTKKRPHTERGGGRAAMGTSARDGAPRRLTPAPAQSAAQPAFLFATVECAAPLEGGQERRPLPTASHGGRPQAGSKARAALPCSHTSSRARAGPAVRRSAM